jgi:hypothetical protein
VICKKYRRKIKREIIKQKQKKKINLKIHILGCRFANNKIRYYGHALRMNEERIPKQLLNMKQKETVQELKMGTTG